MEHDINLNINYTAPKEVWEKINMTYASMPNWAGNNDEPQWVEEDIDLRVSVEPSGLQIFELCLMIFGKNGIRH